MELKNKVAIVTGASKGIGEAIAMSLAKEGAKVAIAARSTRLLEEVGQEIQSTGGEAFVFSGDMSNEKSIKSFIAATKKHFGRLDILVNNAGLGHFSPIAELATEKWDEMFNLNVRGLFIATREALPHLREAGESAVVNISSLAGKNSFVGGGGYAATKHAVMAFSRCLMLEERKNGLRVLAICPGSVATSFSQGRHKDEARDARILQAQDVADSVLHMLRLPQNAMVSEIDIRPSNP
ncbi:MAG: SDR family NAD(P)-dependent oxidoreductase [Calditrichaeota bacterium]|nr:MAG: SDR family NAD(P)-dependent oxidoreductase [Calditrichota bacterium]